MTFFEFLLFIVTIFVLFSLIMMVGWKVQQHTHHSGWIDVTWTLGLGFIGILGALMPLPDIQGFTTRQLVVAALIVVWTGRLGVHIAARNGRVTDDPRYAEIERGFGTDSAQGMFWLCQKQAWVSVPLALSMILAAQNPTPGMRVQDWLAFLVLVAGIAGEALADRQLREFARQPDNKGKVCDVGLWRYSRHPNYFFQWLGWCAYPLFAIEWSGNYPWGWFALLGPAMMYWVLRHVTGVPPLEAHMLRTRGEAFEDYQARTSAFFPMQPRT